MKEAYPLLHWQNLLERVTGLGQSVVEIGAFQGKDTQALERLGARVFAVERKPKCLRTAQREGGIKNPLLADMQHLPLKDSSVDVVFHADVLPMTNTDRQVATSIHEAARVSRRRVVIYADYMSLPYLQCPEKNRQKKPLSLAPELLAQILQCSGLDIRRQGVFEIPEKIWHPRSLYLVIEAVKR